MEAEPKIKRINLLDAVIILIVLRQSMAIILNSSKIMKR